MIGGKIVILYVYNNINQIFDVLAIKVHML